MSKQEDDCKQGAHNLPPDSPAKALTSDNCSNPSAGDFEESQGREGKPPDPSPCEPPQTVNNDVKFKAEDTLNFSNDGLDREYEDIQETLDDPIEPATKLRTTGNEVTLDRDNVAENFSTNDEQ